MENSDDGSIEVTVLNEPPGPYMHTPARLKFLADVESATTGEQLVQANLEYAQHEKGQAAFAFNRAKKVLDHFELLQGNKVHRGFGSMGKAKETFYSLFDNLPPHIVEHLKNAMVWDSRIHRNMRNGQTLFPDRHGRESTQPAIRGPRGRKKKRGISEVDDMVASASSHNGAEMKPDGSLEGGQLSAEGELQQVAISPAESEERIRSIKAARLADAVAHPSFQSLSEEQQLAIKDMWVQALVGSASLV